MTENLYETSQFTNHTNGTYLFQHSPSTLGTSQYGVPNVNSIQSSPMSPLLNHEQLASPVTSGNELSPMLDMPNNAGTWDYNQFGRPALPSWGSSSQEEVTEITGASRIYPFNVMPQNCSLLSCKDNGNDSQPQRLDSFSKAFPSKNLHLLFGESHRTDDKNSENNHISGALQLPQGGTLSDGSDRQTLESPVFNPMAVQSQTQPICDQPGFHQSDNQHPLHGLYQNHQQFHYGYQHHKQKVTNVEQLNRALHKPQGPYHFHQHGYQIHQSHVAPYSMALHQQQQLHLQQRGTFPQKTQLDSHEGHESVQSPTYSHSQDFKTPEQQSIQTGHSLNLLSPHYQDQQHIRPLSQQSSTYLHQHSHDHAQSVPLKQSNMFEDTRLASFEKHSAPNTPVFSSPKEDVQSGFIFPHRAETELCSPHYHSKNPAVSKTVSQTTMRGDMFHLLPQTPQWSQASSPDIPDEAVSPHYRAETGPSRGDGTAKMRCTVCQREFKSLPALNGHMRSHGGFRTHPASLKMREGQIHLSSEVSQSSPIVLPVSVPVKEYQTPGKISLGSQCHKKNEEQSTLIKSSVQSPLPSLRNHPSCVKRSISDGDCVPKQEKKRYRHCLVPLMIPPPSTAQESRGAVLFYSQLRSSSSMGDDTPYTPPPMLSPARPGSGLFSAVSGRNSGTESVSHVLLTVASDSAGGAVTSGKKVINVKPRINIGEEFQAKIPEIKSQSHTEEDTHNAFLLWTPTNELDLPDYQQKVDNLLKLACSSVLPGGGTNTEYVLHCLFESKGDVMSTLEKLLMLKNPSSPKIDYHYAGSDRWTLQEKRQINKALITHHKDFHLVQKMVKTKSVSQCVEYYYTWKKRLRLGARLNTVLTAPAQGRQVEWLNDSAAAPEEETKITTGDSEISDNSNTLFACEVPNSQMNGETWNQNNLGLLCNSPAEPRTSTVTQPLGSGSVRSSPSNSTTSGDTDSAVIFPCTECGKVFFKVKSRNAHMKTHRQQEDTQLWQFPRVPEQDNMNATPGSLSVKPLKQHISLRSLSCDGTADVKTALNDVESMQAVDCPLKNLPALPLDYIQS